jgi:GntR family transcriptional regulator, transcriptional repressor for pyruvate dehydrogenase complex
VRVSDRVHASLRADILEGRLAPGEAVPSERALAERLRVNRHAIREALKRLEQAGLVQISQGGATRVLDWRKTGGLEVMLDLLGGESGELPPPELARSVLEMRASIGIDAARRCAVRADAAARAQIREVAGEAAGAIGVDGPVVDERYESLWRAIVAGSGNVAYQLALNSLMGALAAYEGIAEAVRPTDAAGIRALGAAISEGAADRSAAAAEALLEPDTQRLG